MKSLLVIWAVAFAGLASAQYPAKPIRMILAFPPGGPTDINARAFAQKLSDQMGQQVVGDSRARAGAIKHVASALFLAQMGLEMQHIPYRGSAPALVDVVSGQVQMMIDPISPVAPYAKENRLRALAIAITRRSALLPDVPTLEQAANLPGFEMSAWQGVVVPSGTSPEIVARLNAEVNKALQGADLRARLAAGASEPLGGTSEQYAAYIRSELGRWAKVVRDSGAKLD